MSPTRICPSPLPALAVERTSCYRGKTSAREQKDNCPTTTYQSMVSHCPGLHHVYNFLSKKLTIAPSTSIHRDAHLALSVCGTPLDCHCLIRDQIAERWDGQYAAGMDIVWAPLGGSGSYTPKVHVVNYCCFQRPLDLQVFLTQNGAWACTSGCVSWSFGICKGGEQVRP